MQQSKAKQLAEVLLGATDNATPSAGELLTDADLERESKIPRGTLRALRHRGQIPFLRLGGGRIIRYRRADIEKWLADSTVAIGAKGGVR